MTKTTKTTTPVAPLPALTVAWTLAMLALPAFLAAQTLPRPEDVATPEAAVLAGYDAINHGPGENFDWERSSACGSAVRPTSWRS